MPLTEGRIGKRLPQSATAPAQFWLDPQMADFSGLFGDDIEWPKGFVCVKGISSFAKGKRRQSSPGQLDTMGCKIVWCCTDPSPLAENWSESPDRSGHCWEN